MRIQARHYATGEAVEILCEKNLIVSVEPPAAGAPDLQAGWVAPALFDLQINGCDGRSFNSQKLTAEDVHHVIGVCRRHGIGAFCPTLITNAFSALEHGFRTLARACAADATVAAAVPCFHLEGPYISEVDGPRGAHPRQFVRPPDWQEFCRLQDAADGRIRLVTLAPEHPGAISFIEHATHSGVVIAIGHTAAGADQLHDAISAGARLSTHLGNGAHATLPRHPNYIWEQLADDRLWASIICDGHHLPPAVARCILRVKTPARTILTCDASSLAGLPTGRYVEWGQEFEVLPNGEVVVPGTRYLAGSGNFTDLCIGNAMRFADVSLRDGVDMASARPRALLGLQPSRMHAGDPANLVLFDWGEGGDFIVRATVAGTSIYWGST